MSDFWERAVNFYHMRLIPTVKRMTDRRRIPYTLLTMATLFLSATVLSLLVCQLVASFGEQARLEAEYLAYLESGKSAGATLPDMRLILSLARAERVASSLFSILLWLFSAVLAMSRVMASVIESESYVYGLYMIYGAGKKQLTRQLTVEFLLAGSLMLLPAIPAGYGLHCLMGGTGGFPVSILLPLIGGFLLLIYLCALILARRMLKRPCMRMLQAADTSEFTVSPRRSHMGGLTRSRGPAASAALALWRMRKHYVSLALVVAILAATVCGILSTPAPTDTATEEDPYVLHFTNGLSAERMDEAYVRPLESYAAVTDLSYHVQSTAEALGTHVRLEEGQNASSIGVFLGQQYVTDEIRIACGDGDTPHELGEQVTIPEEFRDVPPSLMTELGYSVEAVPVGGAVYVYPEGEGPTLHLQVGDSVRLYLPDTEADPADRVAEDDAYITVRIVDVIAVGSIRIKGGGEEVCPRITEDYIYLSPSDYGKFDGQTHARAFTAEEAYPSDIFYSEDDDACILAVPVGYFEGKDFASTVTVITPEECVKTPFSYGGEYFLPTDTFYINHTYKGSGVYFGTAEEYLADPFAASALEQRAKQELLDYTGGYRIPMTMREYTVDRVIYTAENGSPFLILPNGEDTPISSLHTDACALRLQTLTPDAPALSAVAAEAYLLTSDFAFNSAYAHRTAYVGTGLLPQFVADMKANGVLLQFPEATFAHTKVILRNGFTDGDHHYLLAEPYPATPRIEADSYPRYISGTGSFLTVGSTTEASALEGTELGICGVFHEDAIGRLRTQSTAIAGHYARNDWTLAPVSEAERSSYLPAGQAILVLPRGSQSRVRVGDSLSVAIRADTSTLSSVELMRLSGERLLEYLLSHLSYEYVEVTITEIREGDGPGLLLSEEDLSVILGQAGIYTRLAIRLAPTVSMADYLTLHAAVERLVKRSGGEAALSYDDRYIIKASGSTTQYPLWLGIGYSAIAMIPLLLLVSSLLFYGKREEEYDVLRAIGQTPKERRRAFLWENLFFACFAGGATALACPLGYFVLLIVADTVKLPLTYGGLRVDVYVLILGAVILSCLGTGWLIYPRLRSPRAPKGRRATASPHSLGKETQP